MTSAFSDRDRIDWLRLARSEAIGAATFAYLIRRYGSASAALDEAPALARRGGRETPLRLATVAEAERELAAGEAAGARLVLGCETTFPRLLAVLDSPPPLIWTLGETAHLNRRTVAIVGARAASAAGRRIARGLAADLGAAGLVVVSGMARGIDSAAHEGALETGTVAVLAGGVDDIYPPENADLAAAIAAGGCRVSERPPGFGARAKDFPRRNRIISGLSLGVVVVEAELRSGSLITARLAGEQGRDVFAVPGSPLDPRARGSNDLLRQGAIVVEEAEDVLRALSADLGPSQPHAATDGFGEPEELGADALARIDSLISAAPTSLDDLARDAGVSAAAIAAVVVELSLAGRVELLSGGLVARR